MPLQVRAQAHFWQHALYIAERAGKGEAENRGGLRGL